MSKLGVLWKKMVSSWSVWGFWEWADSLRELQCRAKSSSYFYQVVILQREADVRLKEEQERVKVKMFQRTVETDNSHVWYGTHQVPAELISRSLVEDVQAVGSMIQFGVTAPDLTLQFLYFFGLIRNVITDLKVKGSHRMMSSKEKKWWFVVIKLQCTDLLSLQEQHFLVSGQFEDFLPQSVVCPAALTLVGVFYL